MWKIQILALMAIHPAMVRVTIDYPVPRGLTVVTTALVNAMIEIM